MPVEVVAGAALLYVAAALLQLRRNVVPNWLCATVLALGGDRWAYEWSAHGPPALAGAGWAIGAALLVFFALIFANSRGWIGGGAAKLAAATPVLIGATDTPLFLLLTVGLSSFLALLTWLRGRMGARRRSAWIGLDAGVPVPIAIGLAALAVLAIQLQRIG